MDNDWDLYAVVKGCTTTATTTTATISSSINMAPSPEDPFITLRYMSPSFLDDDISINFPTTTQDKPVEPFDGLEEFCNEFRVRPAMDVRVGQTQVFPRQHHSQQPQEIPQIQQQQMNHFVGCSLSFQTTNSQPVRPRRRKNQQMKVVQQMTQEELSADSWAWRKYGQKPIKGSPYPRNYYRCSTSKGCGARKHVERSPTNPAIFVVSYSGEHTHPRPIQRSSLSGTTRTKFSPVTTSGDPTTTTTSNTPLICVSNSSCSSSSLASCSSFSPNTPVMEGENPERNDDFEMIMEHLVDVEDEDEDEDILFSNDFNMSEEIYQELSGINNGSSGGSSGGDLLSSGLLSELSPPWSLSGSTATTFDAGCSGAD